MPKIDIEVYANTHGAKRELKETGEAIGGLEKIGENVSKKLDNLWKQFATGQLAVEALKKVFSGAKGLAESFMEVAIETENYQVRLEALLGSQQAATDAMSFFKDVAAKVPFTLQEVIESGTTLVSFGMDMKKWTPLLTDLAAVMGMSLPEAASALGRAFAGGVGAADIFRERGILQIIKDSAQMKYGIEDLSKVSLPQFRDIMYETFTDPKGKIFGASEKLAKTWTGLVSMLQDKWFQFRDAVMKAGVFEKLKEKLEEFNKKLDEWIAEGKMEEWANKLASAINTVIDAVSRLNEILGTLPKGPTGIGGWLAGEISGVNKELERLESEGRKRVIEFRNSLQILKPSIEDLRKEIEKGPKHWEEYTRRMKEMDSMLIANKETIEGWMQKGLKFLGYHNEAQKQIEKTSEGIKKENLWLEEEKKKIDIKVRAINQLIPAKRELFEIIEKATTVFESEIYGFEMAAGAARNFSDVISNLPGAVENVPYAYESATSEIKHYFDGLFNDIATGFGNLIQKWLEGGLTFKNFMLGLWDTIKQAFFRMLGEMIASELIKKLKDALSGALDIGKSLTSAVSSAAKTATSVVSNVGTALSGFSSLATMLGGLGGLANFASSIFNWLKGTEKQTDVTFWLKLIKDNSQIIVNYLSADYLALTRGMFEKLEAINDQALSYQNRLLEDISEYSAGIKEAAYGVWEVLKGTKKAQFGFEGIVTRPTLFMAGEAGPERVIVKPINQSLEGHKINIVLNVHAGDMSIENVMRQKIIPMLQDFFDRSLIRVPVSAVRGI